VRDLGKALAEKVIEVGLVSDSPGALEQSLKIRAAYSSLSSWKFLSKPQSSVGYAEKILRLAGQFGNSSVNAPHEERIFSFSRLMMIHPCVKPWPILLPPLECWLTHPSLRWSLGT